MEAPVAAAPGGRWQLVPAVEGTWEPAIHLGQNSDLCGQGPTPDPQGLSLELPPEATVPGNGPRWGHSARTASAPQGLPLSPTLKGFTFPGSHRRVSVHEILGK